MKDAQYGINTGVGRMVIFKVILLLKSNILIFLLQCGVLVLSVSIIVSDIECSGHKDRFDAFLAQFGFSGISPTTELPQTSPSAEIRDLEKSDAYKRVPSLFINYKRESEIQNEITDEKRKAIKHGSYTFVVIRKKSKKREETISSVKRMNSSKNGGPFTVNEETGVKIPNPQLLNERIKNPVFKSRYPRRKFTQ